jgi:hypothetical protein
VVIVFNFANSYFTYYGRDEAPHVCPNPLYVAATRASERLYLVAEAEEGGKLPFLRIDPSAKYGVGGFGPSLPLPPWIRLRRCGSMKDATNEKAIPSSKFAVTELVKFLPEKVSADVVGGGVTMGLDPTYVALPCEPCSGRPGPSVHCTSQHNARTRDEGTPGLNA